MSMKCMVKMGDVTFVHDSGVPWSSLTQYLIERGRSQPTTIEAVAGQFLGRCVCGWYIIGGPVRAIDSFCIEHLKSHGFYPDGLSPRCSCELDPPR